MLDVFHGAFRANAIALSALTLSAAFAFPAQSAYAASTNKPTRSEAMRARAMVPDAVACTKHGCETVPLGCRAIGQPGLEPGYQMLACR